MDVTLYMALHVALDVTLHVALDVTLGVALGVALGVDGRGVGGNVGVTPVGIIVRERARVVLRRGHM